MRERHSERPICTGANKICKTSLFMCGMLVWAVGLADVPAARSATVFLGPTPYLSQADSPFDMSGLGTTFFLEDFEDGELNTPGISQPLLPITHAKVAPPSPSTDSVDGDDGAIDGDGTSGHSLASATYAYYPTEPRRITWFIGFEFDRDELGFLPNEFGFVWTDGIENSVVKLELYDEDYNVFATHVIPDVNDFVYVGTLGDEFYTGTTPEDTFVGVVSDQEIFGVRITSRHLGEGPPLEIDHVQYGLVPEPTGLVLLTLAILTVSGVVHRSTRRVRGISIGNGA